MALPSPAATLLKVVTETCTLKHMRANTRVCATCAKCYMCIYMDTLTAIRAPTAIHTEAFQISWQPHGATAVKRVVIHNSLIDSNQNRGKE